MVAARTCARLGGLSIDAQDVENLRTFGARGQKPGFPAVFGPAASIGAQVIGTWPPLATYGAREAEGGGMNEDRKARTPAALAGYLRRGSAKALQGGAGTLRGGPRLGERRTGWCGMSGRVTEDGRDVRRGVAWGASRRPVARDRGMTRPPKGRFAAVCQGRACRRPLCEREVT